MWAMSYTSYTIASLPMSLYFPVHYYATFLLIWNHKASEHFSSFWLIGGACVMMECHIADILVLSSMMI